MVRTIQSSVYQSFRGHCQKHLDSLLGQGLPGPLSLADVDSLKKSFDKAGFIDIRTERIPVTFEFDSAEDYAKFNQDIVAPLRTILSNETEIKKTASME